MSFRITSDDYSFANKQQVFSTDQISCYDVATNRVDNDLTSGLEEKCSNHQLSLSEGDCRPVKVECISMDEMGEMDSSIKLHREVEKDFKRIHGNEANSLRYKQTRMSLLGKPLNYRAHKRDIRYRRLQAKIYNFLERPKDWREISYHLLV